METPSVQRPLIDWLRTAVHRACAGRPESDKVTLDGRTRALACLGAAISAQALTTNLNPLVDQAMAAGATEEDVVGTLLAIAPTIGTARVVVIAPQVAHAIGYDIDRALETPDDDREAPGVSHD